MERAILGYIGTRENSMETIKMGHIWIMENRIHTITTMGHKRDSGVRSGAAVDPLIDSLASIPGRSCRIYFLVLMVR